MDELLDIIAGVAPKGGGIASISTPLLSVGVRPCPLEEKSLLLLLLFRAPEILTTSATLNRRVCERS